MYVTRPLSLYYNSANALKESPPGPNSGILVIEDKEAEEQATLCWGLCKNTKVETLPFPQNKEIHVDYGQENNRIDHVYFIPVINQPLSANQYYVMRADGKYKGNMCKCSKEEDATTFCLCTSFKDVKPIPFDHRDIYQQFEIVRRSHAFYAKSIASDGIPPRFLTKYWSAYKHKPSHYILAEAEGLNSALRTQMPGLDFPMHIKHSPYAVVGKWYCPYIFVKESNKSSKQQMRTSMFYEMTLGQFWEEIYSCESYDGRRKEVEMGVNVQREMAFLNGGDIANDDFRIVDGLVWFEDVMSTGNGLGLSLPIWERMKWEEVRGGWIDGDKVERVERVETYEGESGWKKFGCYVLVERFELKRMDGSLALTYDFKHTNKIRIKWE